MAKVARKRGLFLRAIVQRGMSLEVLMSGKATSTDKTLEWLIGRHPFAALRDRHGRSGNAHLYEK